MASRDDFKQNIKNTVAARAGYRCSICNVPTIGPSMDILEGVMKIGIAAHICAASPMGPRYDPEMTQAERMDLDNAIWLCANHATLIDRDTVKYTLGVLHDIKNNHEQTLYKSMYLQQYDTSGLLDLIALGPNVIAYGEIVAFEESQVQVRIDSFVYGGMEEVSKLVSGFSNLREDERYLIDNASGIGRVLIETPKWLKRDGSYFIECHVVYDVERENVHELGNTFALEFHETGIEMRLENGSIATVGGIDSLPQIVALTLSKGLGEDMLSPHYGSRISELFPLYKDTPWLENILKLEIIRLASIPYHDNLIDDVFLPLRCVNRVNSVQVLSELSEKRLLQIHLELDVEGNGEYSLTTYIYIPRRDTDAEQ